MKRLKGSYTVEASLVMGVVLWTMVVLIQAAYLIHDRTVGAMALQETVEIARHQDRDSSMGELAAVGQKKAGSPFSLPVYKFELKQVGVAVEGAGQGGKWLIRIRMNRFKPEEFLRMTTLVDPQG